MSDQRHPYKPLPRGDHEITVRLCYDCDTWHASDDSRLFNENAVREAEARIADLQRALDAERELREELQGQRDDMHHLMETERQARQQAEALVAEYEQVGAQTGREFVAQIETLEAELERALQSGHDQLQVALDRAQQAEGERDRLIAALKDATAVWEQWSGRVPDPDGMIRRAEQAEARLADAVGLRGYATHRRGCGYLRGKDCSCGLHTLLDRVDASAEEPVAGGDGR